MDTVGAAVGVVGGRVGGRVAVGRVVVGVADRLGAAGVRERVTLLTGGGATVLDRVRTGAGEELRTAGAVVARGRALIAPGDRTSAEPRPGSR
ncbi:hypothetical protein [Nonomuraea gerenzanensis]|uniref:Uncharacterized protein n=1 Tax=Nonomuraea gerenzanensis TaxID=93944 RepID=A0A1M4E881_9ACTN|nr:hypothetical protein [Nonomuraea gerenzanensis]UBU17340.1 hypothetical protein LCN96_20640 [Nonomuraea gerenzanensis]SBO95087.1 hypothetical protein BN4615_P4603 [Nonomuraea gerenzanensis]